LNVGWQEREYNPYYAHLARRLCESKYAFRVTFQFAFWDTFKELDNMSQRARINVAHLLAHLLRHEGVYMGVFKVRLPHGRVRRVRRAAHGWSPRLVLMYVNSPWRSSGSAAPRPPSSGSY